MTFFIWILFTLANVIYNHDELLMPSNIMFLSRSNELLIYVSLESITPQHRYEEVDPDAAQAIAGSVQSTAPSARSSLEIHQKLN